LKTKYNLTFKTNLYYKNGASEMSLWVKCLNQLSWTHQSLPTGTQPASCQAMHVSAEEQTWRCSGYAVDATILLN